MQDAQQVLRAVARRPSKEPAIRNGFNLSIATPESMDDPERVRPGRPDYIPGIRLIPLFRHRSEMAAHKARNRWQFARRPVRVSWFVDVDVS